MIRIWQRNDREALFMEDVDSPSNRNVSGFAGRDVDGRDRLPVDDDGQIEEERTCRSRPLLMRRSAAGTSTVID